MLKRREAPAFCMIFLDNRVEKFPIGTELEPGTASAVTSAILSTHCPIVLYNAI
jgi:hypothetical protein